jgi:hypothetical protein
MQSGQLPAPSHTAPSGAHTVSGGAGVWISSPFRHASTVQTLPSSTGTHPPPLVPPPDDDDDDDDDEDYDELASPLPPTEDEDSGGAPPDPPVPLVACELAGSTMSTLPQPIAAATTPENRAARWE